MENTIEVRLNLRTRKLRIGHEILSLEESVVDGRIDHEKEETTLVIRYREQIGDDESPVIIDSENIYELLERKGLAENDRVTTGVNFVESKEHNGYTIPYAYISGRNMHARIFR